MSEYFFTISSLSFFEELPMHLGFGVLNRESINTNGYEYPFNYNFNGILVHNISYNTILGHQIIDFFEGNVGLESNGISLPGLATNNVAIGFLVGFNVNDHLTSKCNYEVRN